MQHFGHQLPLRVEAVEEEEEEKEEGRRPEVH